MKKNTVIIIAIVALMGGLGIGYGIGLNGMDQSQLSDKYTGGGHMMPNGQMMGGNGNMDMDDAMNAMNAGLREKTGDEFDKAFLSEMIIHHEGAVEMAQAALTNAKHQEIKDLANEIITAQNKEINEMKAWQKDWYGYEL